jgi:antirestriction protein ArdC
MQPFYLPTDDEYFTATDAVYMKEAVLNKFNTLTHEIGHWLGKEK